MIAFEKMVVSKAHRILREMSNYTRFDKENAHETVEIPQSIDLDQLVGVYGNKSGSRVFITTVGLLVSDVKLHDKFVRFADMAKTISPPKAEKMTLSVVRVLLLNGETFNIPIEGYGRKAKYRDAWEFHRFMARVIDSYQKRHTNRVNS